MLVPSCTMIASRRQSVLEVTQPASDWLLLISRGDAMLLDVYKRSGCSKRMRRANSPPCVVQLNGMKQHEEYAEVL